MRAAGFYHRSAHVRFILDKVAAEQVILPVLLVSPVIIISPMLHAYIHLHAAATGRTN